MIVKSLSRTLCVTGVYLASLCGSPALAAAPPTAGPVFDAQSSELLGIYESVSPGESIPDVKIGPQASLDSLPLTPAAKQRSLVKAAVDPKDACQVLGPFRLMARPGVKFEVLRDGPNKFVLLFEKSSWGHVRTINLNSDHIDFKNVRPMWNGDSIAKWEDKSLVIDTLHFTDKTWMNEVGVMNSKQLRLTERFRLIKNGEYLEYTATAVDPEVLLNAVSYTRYFKRTTEEITEDNCFAHRAAAENR